MFLKTVQDVIVRPSTEDFIRYVKGSMIPNCNITRQDILRAEDKLDQTWVL